MSQPEYLFAGGDLGDALRGNEQKLSQAANVIPPDHALARSVDELTAELVERFRVEPLVLDWDAKTASVEDATIDLNNDWVRGLGTYDRPVRVTGTRLTYRIPFTGDGSLLKFRPSHWLSSHPSGIVGVHELRLVATATVEGREGLGTSLDAEIVKIKTYVDHTNADVAAYNGGLETKAREHVERRRAKVLGDRELAAKLGVRLEKDEDARPTYAVAPTRRIVTEARGHKASAPEPVLSAETYEQILDVCRGMSVAMERSPSTFAHLNEEALRDFFLVTLNGNYKGAASGETFNHDGKTDILIRERDRNVFIAECAFWDGPARLTAKVGQLLGYTAWRDTQTAILVFNRGRSMSKVLAEISPTIAKHPAFVREIAYGGETEHRFVLRHNDDPARELTLTVLVFDVPGRAR